MTEPTPTNLFPVLNAPVPIPVPEQPYTGLLVWLAMSPRIEGAVVDATASVTYQPYRLLANGTVDVAPDSMKQTYNIGSALEAVAADPEGMGAAIVGIANILQAMLANG